MKIKFTLFAIFFATSLLSQTVNTSYTVTNTEDIQFIYLVGSTQVKGYDNLQTKTVAICSNLLPENVVAPILHLYVCNKADFIGGILTDHSNRSTIIKDILMSTVGKKVYFKVVGEKFTCSFEKEEGEMLKEDSTTTVFYTEKVGVWQITKRKGKSIKRG